MKQMFAQWMNRSSDQWLTVTRRYYGIFGAYHFFFGLALLTLPSKLWRSPSYQAVFAFVPRRVQGVLFVLVAVLIAWALVSLKIRVFRAVLVGMVILSAIWTAGSFLSPFVRGDGVAAISGVFTWGLQLALHINASLTGKKLSMERRTGPVG